MCTEEQCCLYEQKVYPRVPPVLLTGGAGDGVAAPVDVRAAVRSVRDACTCRRPESPTRLVFVMLACGSRMPCHTCVCVVALVGGARLDGAPAALVRH